MPKNETKTKIKKQKKEMAAKKSRKKKAIIAVITLLITACAIGFFVFYNNQQNMPGAAINEEHQENEEIYRYGGQTIRLLADGTFMASLAHGSTKNGTYSKTTEGEITSVIFNSNGNEEIGRIIDNSLHIPREWDDGHGHGNIFPKVN